MIKVFSKDKEWRELEEEIILNTEESKRRINEALENYHITLEHIKSGCILFVIKLLKKEDSQTVLNKNEPVLNLFSAITEIGYWNATLKKMKMRGTLPIFFAKVYPFSPDGTEGNFKT